MSKIEYIPSLHPLNPLATNLLPIINSVYCRYHLPLQAVITIFLLILIILNQLELG